MDTKNRLTIGILVGQETEWLNLCLEHVSQFIGPVLVVGSHAVPAVRETCKRWGAAYKLRPPAGAFSFSDQRQHLLELCTTPWILMLDVDERIDPRSLKEAVRISKNTPNRAYMVRHCYVGQAGLLFVDHQPRLLPVKMHLRFEGHVANTLQAEHSRQERIYSANIEITDQGAVMDPERLKTRSERHRQLAGFELKRLAVLAKQGDPADLSQLGFRYYMMGRHKAATHFFKRLLGVNPEHPEGHYYMARIEAQTGTAGQASALRRLWRLATSGRKHYRIYQYLSRIHGGRGEHKEALSAAEQGAALHQQSASMQHFLAAARYYVQDSDGALNAIKDALKLWPDFAPARSLRNALIRSGRKNKNHLDAHAVMQ